ncbi:MAG TPA: ABC transporter permease [Thermodesulfobacteriota bacterium]|nr:ABC transporter permease [Thermodesulfobacteriota bacterium]
MKPSRVLAYTLRYLYLYKRSMPRLMEIFYWPLLDLLLWGFVGIYLTRYGGELPNFITFFLGALILWDILFRSQQGITVSFLEDVWSRNLLNIFVSPLTSVEYIFSLLAMSVVKLVLASSVMVTLALVLYSFNVFTLGLPLIPLALNLIVMGWSIGIITTALILRFGQEAEVLAWGVALLFQPVSAVFYPVEVLPPSLQAIAFYIPSAQVFEGMRVVISDGVLPVGHLVRAMLLNAAYITAAVLFFAWNFRAVKRKGLLVKIGE